MSYRFQLPKLFVCVQLPQTTRFHVQLKIGFGAPEKCPSEGGSHVLSPKVVPTGGQRVVQLPASPVQLHQSNFRSALLHTYFPPRFRNIFSSKPLNFIASSTPTSKMDLEGSFRPFLQFRKRIYSSRIR